MNQYKTIEIKNGKLKMTVANLGGIITKLMVPDSKGKLGNVMLGHDNVEDYLTKSKSFFGCLIGRISNRISNGVFKLEGKTYKIAKNEAAFGNHLHGGNIGFDKVIWDMTECQGDNWKGVQLHYLSKDMEEGFPGNLDITVYYKLTNDNSLLIEYFANTDRPTLCSLTQHAYFNLSAGKSATILEHELQVDSDFYTPCDKKYRPTGEVLKTTKTPMDFNKPKVLGAVINAFKDTFWKDSNGGIDHNFVLKNSLGIMKPVAALSDPTSGRRMIVSTTEPAIQVYTGNFLDGSILSPQGKKYGKHAGICLETQHYPDATTQPHFPSIELYPFETYSTATQYHFDC